MTLFGLIHGAWHSGAHWDKLVTEIEARGHRAVAMDLPCETGYSETYIDPATAAIEAVKDGDDLVVVGHSLGGFTVPHVADRLGAKHRVYVCAVIQPPGMSLTQFFVEEAGATAPDLLTHATDNGDGSFTLDREKAKEFCYHDCSPEDAEWAAGLLRPQSFALNEVLQSPDLRAGPSTYIVCDGDRVVLPEWSRRRVPDLLGIEPIEMEGSHSPFISRPGELADILVSVA